MGRKSKELNLKTSKSKKEKEKNFLCKEEVDLTKSERKSKEYTLKNIIKIYFNALKTEYHYFEGFKKILDKHDLIDLKLKIEKMKKKGGASPDELLEHAIKNKNENEETWIVFDKDEFQDIHSVICRAKENAINVAFSNPCFELWFLNHYDYRESSLTTDQCIESTVKKFKEKHKKEYLKNDTECFDYVYPKTKTAIRNSKKQYEKIKENSINADKQNPSTLVYLIVSKLEKVLNVAKE